MPNDICDRCPPGEPSGDPVKRHVSNGRPSNLCTGCAAEAKDYRKSGLGTRRGARRTMASMFGPGPRQILQEHREALSKAARAAKKKVDSE